MNTKDNEVVVYNGVEMTRAKMRGLKAAETKLKKKTKEENKYINDAKDEQRHVMSELLFRSYDEYRENNIDFGDPNPYTIVLESPKMLFVNTIGVMGNERWDKEGKSSPKIIIPNNVEFVSFKQKRSYHNSLPYFEVFNEDYKEYISKPCLPFHTCFIWGDYCGAFSTYKEDIKETFRKHLLANKSYYALTFSTRDPSKDGYSATTCSIAVIDFVTKIAKEYGYNTTIHPNGSKLYKPTMYTVIFSVNFDYRKFVKKYKINLRTMINSEVKETEERIQKIKSNYDVRYSGENINGFIYHCLIRERNVPKWFMYDTYFIKLNMSLKTNTIKHKEVINRAGDIGE